MFLFAKEGDADSKIASTTLELAKKIKWLLWLMTDIAVMLLHHWEEDLKDIFFISGNKCWSIKDAQRRLGDILFIDAWSECDSTSATFGKGKLTFMELLLKMSWKLQNVSDIINDYWSMENVGEAAVAPFIEIYGGSAESNLTKLR